MGTQTFALIMSDQYTPIEVWDHWVLFNVPSEITALPENQPKSVQLSNGSVQGLNSSGRTGYDGPCPPNGPAHTYRFFIYALDTSLDLGSSANKQQLQTALSGHILAESLLTGTYQRMAGSGEENGDDGYDGPEGSGGRVRSPP